MPGTETLNLSRFSETVRRQLYDRIAAGMATPPSAYVADDAGLQIVYVAGRWFAFWEDLEEGAEQPEALRTRVVRIGLGADGGVELYDV